MYENMNIQGYRQLTAVYIMKSSLEIIKSRKCATHFSIYCRFICRRNRSSLWSCPSLLDEFIKYSREQGLWQTENNAAYYLNSWIKAGWLREMDDMFSKTDASETVLRFCRNLDERHSSNYYCITFENCTGCSTDFVVAISDSIDDRVNLLEQRKPRFNKKLMTCMQGGDAAQ